MESQQKRTLTKRWTRKEKHRETSDKDDKKRRK
jgi:hypothetical protein